MFCHLVLEVRENFNFVNDNEENSGKSQKEKLRMVSDNFFYSTHHLKTRLKL